MPPFYWRRMKIYKKYYTFYDAPQAFEFVTMLLNSLGVDNVKTQMNVDDGWCEVKVMLLFDETWEEATMEYENSFIDKWPELEE